MGQVDLSKYVPDFQINIDGVKQNELRDYVSHISVNEKIDGDSNQFTIVIADKFDEVSQKFLWFEKFFSQDSPIFFIKEEAGGSGEKKKNVIEILMGYQGKLNKIITGKLGSISTSGFSSDITNLTLIGYDLAHNFLSKKTLSGNENEIVHIVKDDTYSTIAQKVADKVKISSKIDKTKAYRPITIRNNVNLIEFFKEAAMIVGFEFFIGRDTLFFINPRSGVNNPMTLKWHFDLQEFIPTINISNLVSQVEVRGNLPYSNKLVVKRATAGQEDIVEPKSSNRLTGSQVAQKLNDKKTEITNKNFYTEEEAADIAKAQLNIAGDNLITAVGQIIGNPDLMPGQFINVEGIGKQLSGIYYVTEVTNTIDENGFSTRFNARKNNIIL